ncbi:MAG: pantetheine-phosphate adenylyltransferase [Microgenomates group bacterium]|nr:pantetheine-phosphate adenylyltransferase [Microgenomates group bacterium]
MTSYQYKHLILGGTFDHFHFGHQKFIEKAFSLAKFVTIGIVSEKMLSQKKLHQLIENYQRRKKSVRNFLIIQGFKKRSKIIALFDIYGIGKSDNKIDSILVTRNSYNNALKINNIRKKLGLKPLKIITTRLILAEDKKPITSERIRLGEINRLGKSYFKIFNNKILNLPDYLRPVLQRPIGQLIRFNEPITALIKKEAPTMTIAVGDIISLALLKKNFSPEIKIIDFRSKRADITDGWDLKHRALRKYVNHPGTINFEAVASINLAIKKYLTKKEKQTIVIDGEEDLLALPAILLAPLNSLVIYGQLDQGVVFVRVTEDKKNWAESIISRFL